MRNWKQSLILFALILFTGSLLAGCTQAPEPGPAPLGGGGITAESVTQSFFEDLRTALATPTLSNPEVRDEWAERLSSYFAPNERDDQREAMQAALTNFAAGLNNLAVDESLSLELLFDGVEKISDNGQRALVRPVHNNAIASIHVIISRTTDRGVIVSYEDIIGLDRIIGRADGAVPTIKIGDRWYLTEG